MPDVDRRTSASRHCPLAAAEEWRERFRARGRGRNARRPTPSVRYAEVGGWAVSPSTECTADGLLLALAAYSLSRIAWRRHRAHDGDGSPLVGHDAAAARPGAARGRWRAACRPISIRAYRCEMELLRFDSRRPSPKYTRHRSMMREGCELANVAPSRRPVARRRAVRASAIEPSFAAWPLRRMNAMAPRPRTRARDPGPRRSGRDTSSSTTTPSCQRAATATFADARRAFAPSSGPPPVRRCRRACASRTGIACRSIRSARARTGATDRARRVRTASCSTWAGSTASSSSTRTSRT